MYDQDTSARSRSPGAAGPYADQPTAGDRVAEVAGTARREMGTVADEVKTQAGRVAEDMRVRVGEQARVRQEQLADRIRHTGGELRAMAADREPSPARTAVEKLADRSEQMAEYLSKRGPDGVLADVQDFARRRPAAFLVSAAVAGFVVGRMAKGAFTSGGSDSDGATYRSASARPGPDTTEVEPVAPAAPAVGVAQAPAGMAPTPTGVAPTPAPGSAYAAGVAPVPGTELPETLPPTQAPGGERR